MKIENTTTPNMNHHPHKTPHDLIGLVAIFCSFASVGIVALAFCLLRNISGPGMLAIAIMAAAPSIMGIAVAFFMTKSPQKTSYLDS